MIRSLVALFIFANVAFASETEPLQFRGYAAVEKIIAARVMPDGVPFALSSYGLTVPLLDLMGTWSNPASQRVYRNGAPNAVNVLLWYLNLNSFADEVASHCPPTLPSDKPFEPKFENRLLRLCHWPSADAKSEESMEAFWHALIGFDAPEAEYEAWREFFLNSSFSRRPGPEAVRAMTLALVMNPYFILQD